MPLTRPTLGSARQTPAPPPRISSPALAVTAILAALHGGPLIWSALAPAAAQLWPCLMMSDLTLARDILIVDSRIRCEVRHNGRGQSIGIYTLGGEKPQ